MLSVTIAVIETVTLIMIAGAVILVLGLLGLAVRCMRKVEPGTVGVRTGLGGIKVRDSWCVVLPLIHKYDIMDISCLLYTSPSPRDRQKSRMPSSA